VFVVSRWGAGWHFEHLGHPVDDGAVGGKLGGEAAGFVGLIEAVDGES